MDLSGWLTEPETAQRLGVSERTLREWVAKGKAPERRLRRRPGKGKKPEAVYNPEDVDYMAALPEENMRALRFGGYQELSRVSAPLPGKPERDRQSREEAAAEAAAQLTMVGALILLPTSEQRMRVIDAVLHLVLAERCVGGVLDGFLKGNAR
jgi:hypothetical protein